VKKGYKFKRVPCHICGEVVAGNWYVRHLEDKHPVIKRTLLPDVCNDPDTDYVLVGNSCWIAVKNLSVYIRKCDDGVSIAVYPRGSEMNDSIAETWALYTEGEPDETM
jgi:hypothetical protein